MRIVLAMIYFHTKETSCIVTSLFQWGKKKKKKDKKPYVSLDLEYCTLHSLI